MERVKRPWRPPEVGRRKEFKAPNEERGACIKMETKKDTTALALFGMYKCELKHSTPNQKQTKVSYSHLFLTDAVGPRHGIEVVLHADHGRGVDGAAFEDRLVDLEVALLVLLHHAEDLGQGAVLGGV